MLTTYAHTSEQNYTVTRIKMTVMKLNKLKVKCS